jgi:hypothetical protein
MLASVNFNRVFRSCVVFSVRTGSFCFISPSIWVLRPRSRGWYSTGSVHLLTHWHTFCRAFREIFVFNWFRVNFTRLSSIIDYSAIVATNRKKKIAIGGAQGATFVQQGSMFDSVCSEIFVQISASIDCWRCILTWRSLTATSRVPSISVPSNLVCKTFPLTSTVFLAFINWMFLLLILVNSRSLASMMFYR